MRESISVGLQAVEEVELKPELQTRKTGVQISKADHYDRSIQGSVMMTEVDQKYTLENKY